MDPLRDMGKGLLIFGLLLATVGAALLLGGRIPFRLGRLPGDVVYQGRHTTFYFPIVTSIVISVVLTLLFWIFGSFRR